MKTRVLTALALFCLLAFANGCYSTVDGHSKMGMPFTKDSIDSRYERPVDQIFAAAKDVLILNGTLVGENTVAHTLEAKVDNNTVGVKVEAVEPNISHVIVQVRNKSGFSNIDLASQIDKRIALQLQAGPSK